MKRKRLTPNQRADLFEAHGGICWRCKLPIDTLKQKWVVGHGIKDGDLGCGGSDTIDNMAPEHTHCNKKYADETGNTLAAKGRRIRQRRMGIKSRAKYNWKTKRYEMREP